MTELGKRVAQLEQEVADLRKKVTVNQLIINISQQPLLQRQITESRANSKKGNKTTLPMTDSLIERYLRFRPI